MRIFCDTNIVTEIIENRQYAPEIMAILSSASKEDVFFVSAGGFYTITYLMDRFLKSKGVHNPERNNEVKKALKGLLRIFTIATNDQDIIVNGLEDECFSDFEDSYQFQTALSCHADVLLTINIKDFKNVASDKVKILTPRDFA